MNNNNRVTREVKEMLFFRRREGDHSLYAFPQPKRVDSAQTPLIIRPSPAPPPPFPYVKNTLAIYMSMPVSDAPNYCRAIYDVSISMSLFFPPPPLLTNGKFGYPFIISSSSHFHHFHLSATTTYYHPSAY
jgi:hypothetical protein